MHGLAASGLGGKDLLAYGQEERATFQACIDQFRASFDADCVLLTDHMAPHWFNVAGYVSNPLIPIRLIDFELGIGPEPWRLIWVFEFEAIARDFWDMAQQPAHLMPGSWIA
jgi:hypothetical protein